jgi:hypothetical protein
VQERQERERDKINGIKLPQCASLEINERDFYSSLNLYASNHEQDQIQFQSGIKFKGKRVSER